MSRHGELTRVEGWLLETVLGIRIARSPQLQQVGGVGHAFSTRVMLGGGDFDVGAPGAKSAATDAARARLCAAAGLAGQCIVDLKQIHGNRVFELRHPASTDPEPADGAFALQGQAPGSVAAVRCADCVPILLASTDGRAVAAIHAGWRGTAQGIAVKAVRALADRGVPAGGLTAALGPAIGVCCYEVGPDVAETVARTTDVSLEAVTGPRPVPGPAGGAVAGRLKLDLRRANRLQLERVGLRPESIHVAPWCTACDRDLFFSYRRSRGLAGRQMALIGWGALA